MRTYIRTVVAGLLTGLAMASLAGAATAGTAPGKPKLTLVPTGMKTALFDIDFPDARTGFAVGDAGAILKSQDGGKTWHSLKSGIPATFRGVDFVDRNHGFAVGSGTVLATADGGVTWVQQKVPLNPLPPEAQIEGIQAVPPDLVAVSFVDQKHGFAVGASTILSTTDGGQTWNSRIMPRGYPLLTGVSFTDAKHGHVSATSGSASIFTSLVTTDGGETWLPQQSDLGAALVAVSFAKGGVGHVTGSSGVILETANDGRNWQLERSNPLEDLDGIAFSGPDRGVAVGVLKPVSPDAEQGQRAATAGRAAPQVSIVLSTTDVGRTWTSQAAPGPDRLWGGVAFASANRAFAVGGRGKIVRIDFPASTSRSSSKSSAVWLGAAVVAVAALLGAALVWPRRRAARIKS